MSGLVGNSGCPWIALFTWTTVFSGKHLSYLLYLQSKPFFDMMSQNSSSIGLSKLSLDVWLSSIVPCLEGIQRQTEPFSCWTFYWVQPQYLMSVCICCSASYSMPSAIFPVLLFQGVGCDLCQICAGQANQPYLGEILEVICLVVANAALGM